MKLWKPCIIGDRCGGCNRCGVAVGGVLRRWDTGDDMLDLDTVRLLSVKQPYAELIARGDKDIELRTKAFKYRGLLVIVSCARRAEAHPDVDGPRSRAVALVEMVDARPATRADSKRACCKVTPGKDFAWVLRLVRRLDIDVHVKGQLSIYPPPPDLRAALEAALTDSDRSDWERSEGAVRDAFAGMRAAEDEDDEDDDPTEREAEDKRAMRAEMRGDW